MSEQVQNILMIMYLCKTLNENQLNQDKRIIFQNRYKNNYRLIIQNITHLELKLKKLKILIMSYKMFQLDLIIF